MLLIGTTDGFDQPWIKLFQASKERLSRNYVLIAGAIIDALAKTHGMAKQKFRSTRPGGFSGAKVYMWYAEVLKNHCNDVGRTFCDAINNCSVQGMPHFTGSVPEILCIEEFQL